MSFFINTLRSELSELPLREIARYMGMRSADLDDEMLGRINKLMPRFLEVIHCKSCWVELPVRVEGNTVDFRLLSVESGHLAENLEGCSKVILFAATIGNEADRLCKSASITSPANAVIFDAMGTTAIECFCDELCDCFENMYPEYSFCPRFSPGYGDLPLGFQREIVRILDTHRKIGLTLSDSLMMLPQKSVTAIVGMRPKEK